MSERRGASAETLKFWADLKADPQRFADYIKERRAKVLAGKSKTTHPLREQLKKALEPTKGKRPSA